MDTLIGILIVAMATIFTVESLVLLNFTRFDTRVIAGLMTFPVAIGYHYLLGEIYPNIVVVSAASSFASIFLGRVAEKVASSYTEIRRPRR